MHLRYAAGLVACLFTFSSAVYGGSLQGTVVDPSGAPISGAQVALLDKAGVAAQTATSLNGGFAISVPGAISGRLMVTSPGFRSAAQPVSGDASGIRLALEIAPVVDSIQVAGSAIDVASSEQGGSTALIPNQEVVTRNEPVAMDLLRQIPGVTLTQTGATGGVTGLYIRGGDSKYSSVQIDGVTVNAFGGDFDFAHVPSAVLGRIEVVSGPQSATYGSYAGTGVVNFITREPSAQPTLDVTVEGGSHQERRFIVGGGGTLAGIGIAAVASRYDTNGPVANSDYRNEELLLNLRGRLGHHSLAWHSDFNSSENGVPGAYGSDPMHTFYGLDTVSRNKNNFGDYSLRDTITISERVHQDFSAAYFRNNNGFTDSYGYTFNRDRRHQVESRTVASLNDWYTLAIGESFAHERVDNSYVTDSSYRTFPVERNDASFYLENRIQSGNRFFLNAGLRGEWLHTQPIPSNGYSRPAMPAHTVWAANPKLAVAWMLHGTRLHASAGTGMRPPSKWELAYTNNPALKPERTRAFDAGAERELFSGHVSVDATYFYTRFYDLIATLSGSLSDLSRYQSDNLSNARAQGVEVVTRVRPSRSLLLTGSYTHLKAEVLSLNGSSTLAQLYFKPGQELTRRPADSGSFVLAYMRGRLTADITGSLRGSTLDVEPGWGASNGFYRNPGYENLGVNINLRVAPGVEVYANLRNAFNQRYEEVFGFPSPRLNFVTGIKWRLAKLQ
jgi:outer membrane cobalamin receptor